jgi:hypothetical protein
MNIRLKKPGQADTMEALGLSFPRGSVGLAEIRRARRRGGAEKEHNG